MANLESGMYSIHNCGFTSKVMSLYGATDKNRGWIHLRDDEGADVDLFYVQRQSNGKYKIYIPCSGKWMSKCMSLTSEETKSWGQIWVSQWSWGYEFEITACGTISYGNDTYTKYRITHDGDYFVIQNTKGHANQFYPGAAWPFDSVKWVRTLDVNISSIDSSKKKYFEWFFIPEEQCANGIYEMVPLNHPSLRVGIEGESTGDKAWARCEAKSGSDAQKVVVKNKNGRVTLKMLHSGLYLDADCDDDNVVGEGHYVCQQDDPLRIEAIWQLAPYYTAKIGGADYMAYKVYNTGADGSSLAMAIDKSSKWKAYNYLWLAKGDGGANGTFAFVPTDILDTSLTAPWNVGFMVGSEVRSSGVAAYDTTKGYFEHGSKEFQCRFRYRTGTAQESGSVSWEDWTAWMGVEDGISGNDGWGNRWEPNLTFSSSAVAKLTKTLSIPSVDSTRKFVQVELQAREFARTYKGETSPVHGNVGSSGTLTLCKAPTLNAVDIAISPKGLQVYYTSDWRMNGVTVNLLSLTSSAGASVSPRRTTGLPGREGCVVIDWAALGKMPNFTDTYTATLSMDTGYLSSNRSSYTAVPSSVGGMRAISPSVEEGPGKVALVTPDTNGTARLFVMIDGEMTEVTRSSDGKFRVPVPFNSASSAFVVEDDLNGTWGFATVALPEISSDFAVWNFGDGDWCILDLGRNGLPTMSSVRERSNVTYETTGRKHPATRFKRCVSRDLTVSGCVIEDNAEHGSKESFVRLLDAGHATFRNERGEMVSVAVTGITDNMESSKYTDITVKQHQETT